MPLDRNRVSPLLASCLVFPLGVAVGLFVFPGVQAADSNKSRLQQLMNERVDVLQKILEKKQELHKLREMGLREVYDARIALMRAKLDLCDTDQQRIPIFEQMLTEAQQNEKILATHISVAPGLPQGAERIRVDEATADRLNIEIELERLKLK